MKKEQKIRQSNFELLRIIAMFFIVSHHLFVHGIFHYTLNNATILDNVNNFIFQILASGGKIGVALFILITGYFSSTKEFNLKKILYVYLQSIFYSLLIFSIIYFVKYPQINIYGNILSLLSPNFYWFVNAWLLLMICSPVLNYILKDINPEIIKKYLIFFTIILFILPSFKINYGKSNLLLFIYLYILGGSIRLGYIKFNQKQLNILTLLVLCCYFFYFFLNRQKNSIDFKLIDLNTIYTLIISIWLFVKFSTFKFYNNFINFISTSMFGVYLIHDNCKYTRPYLWRNLLNLDKIINSQFRVFLCLGIIISVFIACIIIDKFLSYLYNPIIDKISKFILNLQKLANRVIMYLYIDDKDN